MSEEETGEETTSGPFNVIGGTIEVGPQEGRVLTANEVAAAYGLGSGHCLVDAGNYDRINPDLGVLSVCQTGDWNMEEGLLTVDEFLEANNIDPVSAIARERLEDAAREGGGVDAAEARKAQREILADLLSDLVVEDELGEWLAGHIRAGSTSEEIFADDKCPLEGDCEFAGLGAWVAGITDADETVSGAEPVTVSQSDDGETNPSED